MKELTITWSAEDIQSLRPELSIEQAEQLLGEFSKTLHERSIEEGWYIIRDLLSIKGVTNND